jgi:perosamine synthetase
MQIPISKNWFGLEELSAVQQPLKDSWVVQGKQVKAFEQAFSKFTGASASLACSSGTAALHIAVAALGLSAGEEVIVPAFTWVATSNVVELLGGMVRFCDIDLDTYNLSIDGLEASINSNTVGICPVHLFGLCAEMSPVLEAARRGNLWVVEDAACALGAWYRDSHAGTLGDIGCFSFHPRKSITTGEGGMLTTIRGDLVPLLDGYRNHGAVPQDPQKIGNIGHSSLLPSYSIAGFNYRLTDIQGALGAAQMQRLNWLLDERKRCADFYQRELAEVEWLRLPRVPKHQRHAWQSYVTLYAPEDPSMDNVERLSANRNELMRKLEANGISTRQGTHAPAHLEYYRNKYGIRPHDFPNAYMADRLTLALPIFPGMAVAELEYVVNQIKKLGSGF